MRLAELVPGQRPVVDRARQPEAVLDQHPLAGHVALVHRADLRHGDVRLVDHEQEVLGEVVEQRVRRAARLAAVDVPRVVLDPGAAAHLAHHLDVVGGAHAQPLRLEQLAGALQLGEPLGQLGLDTRDGAFHPLLARDVVARREDIEFLVLADHLAGQRVQRGQPLDLVAEHLDPDGEFLVLRDDLDRVAPHPEGAPGEGHVVAGVLHPDQVPEQAVPVYRVAYPHLEHAVHVLLRRAQAVDARHRRDHDRVPAGEQRVGRRVPQPLHLVVDRGVLLDVGVGLRDVGLGLVVVVVRDEVLDGVVRQHLAELVGELGGERLVGQHDEDGALQPLGEPRHGRRLAGSGRAQQDDVLLPAP